jgi:homoserine O-acetyltransferase
VSAAVTLPVGVELCHLANRVTARGERLDGAQLAFERQGPEDAPAVLVLGGISAGRHLAAHGAVPQRGWWEGIVGANAAIDTTRFCVLGIDWLGGVGCSTAPGEGEGFPFVGAEDQADAIVELLDRLRIGELTAVVGASYGGMVALQLAARHPSRVRRVVALAAAHCSHPLASAWRAVQRRIVALGAANGCAAQGLALARQLAMTTYRSEQEFGERFARIGAASSGGEDLSAWLEAHGDAFARRWSVERFVCLNESIDAHRVDPARIVVPTTLVSWRSDRLVPNDDVRTLAAALPQLVRHVELDSPYGHDAFLKEVADVAAVLKEVL